MTPSYWDRNSDGTIDCPCGSADGARLRCAKCIDAELQRVRLELAEAVAAVKYWRGKHDDLQAIIDRYRERKAEEGK